MRKILLLGNWKMNKTPLEAGEFMSEAKDLLELADQGGIEIGVAPTFLCLANVSELAPEGFLVSSQNVNEHDHGAYTGEVSAPMLKSVGVGAAIIGHSERREYNGETSACCNLKIKALLKEGLVPVYCCGESLATFEEGKTLEFVSKQIKEGFAGLSKEEAAKVVVAYEPIWAIGTGKSATKEIAQDTIKGIREVLRGLFGETAEEIRILYGGSVKPENIASYMACPDIDGALVGGASLTTSSFRELIKGASL